MPYIEHKDVHLQILMNKTVLISMNTNSIHTTVHFAVTMQNTRIHKSHVGAIVEWIGNRWEGPRLYLGLQI